jgi:hypothetical protein
MAEAGDELAEFGGREGAAAGGKVTVGSEHEDVTWFKEREA